MSIGDWLLNPSGLTPHGFCLSWSPGLVALHAGSDALIGIAYFSIPLAIGSFTRQRDDLKYSWVAYLFIAFILACGSTHLWSIVTLWFPAYGVEGLIKVVTALLSVATAILLWPLIPTLLAVPSTARLEAMNAELALASMDQTRTAQLLRASEAGLQSANLDLERRVAERTAELVALNDQLQRALFEKSAALKQASEQETLLGSILDTGPDAMLLVDSKGAILRFSSSAERLFDRSSDEALGQNIKLLVPDFYPHPTVQPNEPVQGQYVSPVVGRSREVEGLRKKGARFPMLLYVGEIQLEDGLYFTTFVRDLTHIREAADRENNLRIQLNHMWRKNSLGEMAAVLAHELNQPLAAISNYTGGARSLITRMELQDESLLEAVEKVGNQAIRAGDIVRRIRNFIPSNNVSHHPEDLRALIVEVDFMVELVAREAGVTVLYDLADDPELVMADRIQIQQVILNLVRNAIEATRFSALRVVQISSRLCDGSWTVNVDDSGPGVSEEVVDHLFVPMTSTKIEGMGLGLSLSKTIVEQHGGRIWNDRSNLGGASFQFRLPIWKSKIEHNSHSELGAEF